MISSCFNRFFARLRPTFDLRTTLHVGDFFEYSTKIDDILTFDPTGKGTKIYATSSLVDQVEYVCSSNLEKNLDNKHASVGFLVDVDHRKPVSIGETIKITAKVTDVTNTKATFKTTVYNSKNEIVSSGIHKRALIRFE